MTDALTDRLRAAASAGYDEWRVQDPKDGAYCIAYSWPDVGNPEREARAWLADHKARFPDSPKAGYVAACVRVVPLKDRLLAEAADEIALLRGQRMVLLELLTEAADVIHNLPDEAETQDEADRLNALKDQIADARAAVMLTWTAQQEPKP